MSMANMLARAGAAAQQGARRSRTGPDLAAQIIAEYAAASWVTPFIGLIRKPSDVSLVGSAIATLVDRSGNANHATQATGSARPTYSATAINSKPGMTCDGGDSLVTGNIDTSGKTAFVIHCLFSDTDTASRNVVEYGSGSAAPGGLLLGVNVASDTIWTQGRVTANTRAQSAGTISMASPAVVTATFDTALATDEMTIRHAGVDVTASRALNNNNGAPSINSTLKIGMSTNSAIGAVVFAAGNTAIPTSTVAAVEALLAAQWGL